MTALILGRAILALVALATIAACKPKSNSSTKSLENATNTGDRMFHLNHCRKLSRSVDPAVRTYLDDVTPIISEKFTTSPQDQLTSVISKYLPVALELLGNLPKENVEMLVNDPNIHFYVYDIGWPDTINRAALKGNEAGISEGFAFWSRGQPPGLYFGPGVIKAKSGAGSPVTTMEAFRHGFIRGLLSYQVSKILAGLDLPPKLAEAGKEAQSGLRAYVKHVLAAFRPELEKNLGKEKAERVLPQNADNARELQIFADIMDSVYCSDFSQPSSPFQYLKTNYKATCIAALKNESGLCN